MLDGYAPIGRLSSTGWLNSSAPFNVSWSFTRNPASQIRTETQSNDAYSWQGHVNVSRGYTTNGLNQYTQVGAQGHCHDANGNLTADGAVVYLYDVENRLVEARAAAGGACTALAYTGTLKTKLRYDPLGRLFEVEGFTAAGVSNSMRRLLYDGDALIAEYDATGVMLSRYIHGPNAGSDDPIAEYIGAGVLATDRRNLYADSRGSIVLRTKSGGGTPQINAYDEFGIPDANNVGRFQYTGQAWIPELGMYYYKARIYSATLGRFLQTDPIGYKDQINLYAYVGNDPVNGIDPDGKDAYFISRPLGGSDYSPYDHAFVGVVDKNGKITIFSYEPIGEFLRPSNQNSGSDSTYNVDLGYFKDFLNDPSSVPGNKIDAPDKTVISIGNAFNRALTVNDIDYEYVPTNSSDGCNSNCAAGIIPDEAREESGKKGSHPAPRGAQTAPGRSKRGSLDGLVSTNIEKRRAKAIKKRLDN